MVLKILKVNIAPAVLLILLASGSALAQEPETEVVPVAPVVDRSRLLYIDVPVPIEPESDLFPEPPEPLEPLEPEEDALFTQRNESISQYNTTVVNIESVGGVWDRGLAQELMSLGGLQQQQGDHAQAIDSFSRAIHISRINSGLHTLEQIPVIEKMIQSQMVLGNWEDADIYNNYLFYVQQKAYGRDDPRLIPVLGKLATWNIQAFNIGYGELLGIRLRDAQIMFSAAAQMVGVHFGKNDERFVGYLRNIANSSYLLSANQELMQEIDRPEYRTAQSMLIDKLNQREAVLPLGFQSGEKALRDIVDFYSDSNSSPYDLAEALTNLGDWYLIFKQRRLAEEYYMGAWMILETEENSEELLQRLFGQVVPLPTFVASIDNPASIYRTNSESDEMNGDFADLMFDVTAAGLVRNVTVISEQTVENSSHHNRLRTEIRRSIYRPVIVDGEPKRSNGNTFRYQYWY
ncbi:MAG: hypothetical protein COA96_07465 [SAR86 cluster bacterium]|uniref:Uncharacterized protein n=1 Tax=SAR86 cluster bacterium TaxID=2030880 RepID=A0A2A5B1R4_9GAMM|nr:MAG: hypothetical protein COA96_07465 [SAR86 cluster bacterium]